MRHQPYLKNSIVGALRSGVLALLCLSGTIALAAKLPPVQTVFMIVLENHNWSDIKGNPDAPYLNQTLLPISSYCDQYFAPPGLHPSLPNYLWLEAGTNFGVFDNSDPAVNHQATSNHLTFLLEKAGISWKTYQEDIDGSVLPLTSTNGYVPKHNPFVYFDDVTGTNDLHDSHGLAHIRPYAELAADLTNQTVARYNFITPNLCNGGHDVCGPISNSIRQTDAWLAREVPSILASRAYQEGGALFITWDEGSSYENVPIGMIVLSPFAKGDGYSNSVHYTHSSTLRTMQEIFGVRPFLGDASNAIDLGDLFLQLKIRDAARKPEGGIELTVQCVPGTTNTGQVSEDLAVWNSFSTNVSAEKTFQVVDALATNSTQRFYRFLQAE